MTHILITGASSGIGKALALSYAAPNVRLSLHGRSAERLEEVAAACRKKSAEAIVTAGDVTNTAAMKAWIDDAENLEPINLLIANAGISGGTSAVEETRKQIDLIFDVNLNGVLNVVDPTVTHMRKRGRGQIAIMSSLAGFRGYASSSAYCASKAAVRVYGEALRAELSPRSIQVNVICPGFIKTPMTDVNTFKMPFLMEPDEAVRIIREGLEKNKPRIAFPLPMYVGLRLMAALPQDFVNRCLGSSFRKPAMDI